MTQQTPTQCGGAESQRQMEASELQARMRRIGQVILVLSGKGGVGKSTVAANLAVSLANAGQNVGLLDVDLHGPSIMKILGLASQRMETTASGCMNPVRVSENLLVMSIGLLLDDKAQAVVWRGPMKFNVIRQLLTDVEWGTLDALVVDCPPGTGDEPLAVAQLVGEGARAVVVTTPQEVAVDDVRRSISFCRMLALPIAGVVENMSGLCCPHCGGQVDVFGAGGGQTLAMEMGVPFLGRIPIDPRVVASGDSGRPFVESFADGPAAQAFAAVAEPILHHGTRKDQTQPGKDTKEIPTMKIAIPTADGQLCMHFGHCERFALIAVDEASKAVRAVDYLTPPPHEPGVLPRWLGEQGATVIIAGGMGQRAQGLFAQNGIEVVVGAQAGAPEEIAAAYLAGTLEVGGNVCDH